MSVETEIKSINGKPVCDSTARSAASAKYAKPDGGIPKTDLASAVQTSLGKADSAQPKTIADAAGYFSTDTVEGALAEIGAELSGINSLLGSGVIE